MWDGKERRANHHGSDHDNITRILVIMEAYVNNFDKHRADFQTHLMDDKKNFDMLFKAYWMGCGVITVFLLIIKYVK